MFEKTTRGSNAGWREIAGRKIYFRSKWEFNYCLYLQWCKEQGHILDWDHEPKTFWFEAIKRGVRSYLPDFLISLKDGSGYWVEVKGWLDPKSATKLKRMAKYYPLEKIELVQADWFAKNNALMRNLIKEWE